MKIAITQEQARLPVSVFRPMIGSRWAMPKN
jgi:hypothetical protein